MKVGIMGGTFDPIHHGHLIAAETAREEIGLEEVWFIPANVPPHKAQQPVANEHQRLAMTELATAHHAHFRVIDLEIRRGGTSYSVETIRQLKQLHPTCHFSYIVGADMVQYLPHWHRIDELVKQCDFIGLERPGFVAGNENLAEHIRARVKMAPMPLLQISSSDIRQRRKIGRSIRYFLPELVYDYIEEHHLYEL